MAVRAGLANLETMKPGVLLIVFMDSWVPDLISLRISEYGFRNREAGSKQNEHDGPTSGGQRIRQQCVARRRPLVCRRALLSASGADRTSAQMDRLPRAQDQRSCRL